MSKYAASNSTGDIRMQFKSGREDPEFFKNLEKTLESYFEYNPVAKLGFYAIMDGDIFGKALGPEYEGGANFQVGLEIASDESFRARGMDFKGAYSPPQYLDQESYDGRITIKQDMKSDDKVTDVQKRFTIIADDETSTFLHELTHAGHMVLNAMLKEGTSPISELSPKKDPKYIRAVPMGIEPKLTEQFMADKKKGVPQAGILGGYQREQYENETTNIIARLGLDKSGLEHDHRMMTENLVDLLTYDSMTKAYINADAYQNLNVGRSKRELHRLLNPVYNESIRTTVIPIGDDLSQFKEYSNEPYDSLANPLRQFGDTELDIFVGDTTTSAFGFYPSDKDYIKMLRSNNEKLNSVATKVLNIIESPPSFGKVKKMPDYKVPEKPSWWQKTVDLFVNKPADAIGAGLDALPFNEGGQVKSLDDQMKELKVD